MIGLVDRSSNSGFAEGDRVVIVAGSPPGVAGHTNMIRVRRIGAPLYSGLAAVARIARNKQPAASLARQKACGLNSASA